MVIRSRLYKRSTHKSLVATLLVIKYITGCLNLTKRSARQQKVATMHMLYTVTHMTDIALITSQVGDPYAIFVDCEMWLLQQPKCGGLRLQPN